MPRIRTVDVKETVSRLARAELQAAAGNDLLSRTEQSTLAADLQEAAERVRTTQGPNARVTVGEALDVLTGAVNGAIDSVNQTSGSGVPFLSQDEIRNLTTQDAAIGARVQTAVDILKGQVVPPPSGPLSGAEAKTKLDALLPGVFFDGLLGSEGGEPITAVHVPGPFIRIDRETFARAFGLDTTTDVGFLERFERPSRDLFTEIVEMHQGFPGDVGARARTAIDLVKGELRDLRLVVVGKDGAPGVDANHPTYIVGLAADGSLVGLKTGVIWT